MLARYAVDFASVRRTLADAGGCGHRPFTAVTGVRIPVGTPIEEKTQATRKGGLFVARIADVAIEISAVLTRPRILPLRDLGVRRRWRLGIAMLHGVKATTSA